MSVPETAGWYWLADWKGEHEDCVVRVRHVAGRGLCIDEGMGAPMPLFVVHPGAWGERILGNAELVALKAGDVSQWCEFCGETAQRDPNNNLRVQHMADCSAPPPSPGLIQRWYMSEERTAQERQWDADAAVRFHKEPTDEAV